jgi:hypothetical protein
MNNEESIPKMSEHFIQHKRREAVDAERDLLLFEIAKRLGCREYPGDPRKLAQDHRFMNFSEHCLKMTNDDTLTFFSKDLNREVKRNIF